MKKEKRAQAAFEFMITYGWAFIIIIVMIGSLAYFGLQKTDSITPERCTMTPELSCENHAFYQNGFIIILINNVGEPINVRDIRVTKEDTQISCSDKQGIAATYSEQQKLFLNTTCDFSAESILPGRSEKLGVEIDYYKIKNGIEFTTTVSGELLGRIGETSIS